MESKIRTINLKGGRRTKNIRGVYANGGKLQWGYYQEKKKDHQDKTDRPVLTDQVIKGHYHEIIFEGIVTQHFSQERIAEILNKQGIKTAFGNEWTQESISDLLSEDNRDALCGHIITGRYKYKMVKSKNGKKYSKPIGENPPEMWGHIDVADPIFTPEQFDKLRAAIKSNTTRGNEPAGDVFLSRHLDMRCGICNDKYRPSYSNKNKNGGRRHYYAPDSKLINEADRQRRGVSLCTHINSYVPADKVDDYIWHTLISQIIYNKKMLDTLLNITSKEQKIASLEKTIQSEEQALQKTERKLEKLLDSFLEDALDRATLVSKQGALQQEKKKREDNIAKHKREILKIKNSISVAKQFRTEREQLLENMFAIEEKLAMMPFEEKKALLRYIYSDAEFKILPITKEEAIALTPPDENWQESQRWWFNRGKDVGVFLAWDGFIPEDKLLNLLKQLNNNNIVSDGPHCNIPLLIYIYRVGPRQPIDL